MDRRSFISMAAPMAASMAALWAASPLAQAQAFPSRAVRMISPYAAGGGPDIQLRQAAPLLAELLGQSVVVENKVGAAGVMAAQYVAAQPADGHTCLLGSNTHLIQKILQPGLKFDPLADFAPVSNLAASPAVLVVRADAPYKTAEALVQAIQARPNQLNYSSGGIGTAAHLAGATLASLAGLKVAHIPLKGSVEIAASLLRGDTEYAFPIAGTAIPQVRGGKLRALAVTSRTRLPQMPEVPTLQELLKSELAVQESWFGIWAPAKTGPDVLTRLNAAIQKAVATPTLKAAYEAAGSLAVSNPSAAAFAEFVRHENSQWNEVVKLAGVSMNN